MNETNSSVCSILRHVLWGENSILPSAIDWQSIYTIFCDQAIAGLPAYCIKELGMPAELTAAWKKRVYQGIANYYNIQTQQIKLLDKIQQAGVNVVVLKGTSAAQYYPHPELRTMGDIDLLVSIEQFDDLCTRMSSWGYSDITSEKETRNNRHRSYQFQSAIVEIHKSFASVGTDEQTLFLDQQLFNNILSGRTVLPHTANGLVLIEHIGQHMHTGIGLRQILDWMMYVDHCLDDVAWEKQFKELACRSGVDKLAIYITKMCQIYLGLRTEGISWCNVSDDSVCTELMDYIMKSGNFGRAFTMMDSNVVIEVPAWYQPAKWLRYFQKHGEQSWKALKKHPRLRCFAWIYQIGRYVHLTCTHQLDLSRVGTLHSEGKKRYEMFRKLGIDIGET